MIDSAWIDWYRAQHDLRCLASGQEFEDYVTDILSRLHPDYVNPDPMGTRGDGGCDGLAERATILYACYGQRANTEVDRKTKEKLEADFARALASWPTFTTWRFVTNASFGPTPTKSLITLQQQHDPASQRPITLELWKAPEDLWWKAVKKLTLKHLDEIMPGVPHSQDVELSDLVELINALEATDGQESDVLEPIHPVPATKMDFNQLPEITRAEFNEGRMLSADIDKWFARQAEPDLRDSKARRFRMIYEDAKRSTNDVREIIHRIYAALGGPDFNMSTPRANAVYAITVYFFDSCDIFEKPPDDYRGGDASNVITD
jgi:hypothetical protein